MWNRFLGFSPATLAQSFISGSAAWVCAVLATLSFGLKGQSLDELLDKRVPQMLKKDQRSEQQWKGMIAAFAVNDEEQARRLADDLLSGKQALTPGQIRATQILLQLCSPKSSGSDDSFEVAQLKKDASEALAAVTHAEQQLARILAEGAQLPKQFPAGGQTHQRWLHLSNQEKGFTATRDANKKKFEELKAKYDAVTKAKSGSEEDELISLATALSDEDEIEGAMALCSLYIRKNPPAEKVVVKGQELVLLKEAFAKGGELFKAVEAAVRKLMGEKKVWAAQEELVKSQQMIKSRIEDANEKKAFAKLITPLGDELSRLIDAAKAKAAEVRALAGTDAEEAARQLAILRSTAVDIPEIEAINVAMSQTTKADLSVAYEKRLQVIRELAATDVKAAKGLLNELQKGLSKEDAVILNAQLMGVRRGIWMQELDAIRHDIDEAHSLLERVSSNFLYTLKEGSHEEIRAALTRSEARENMTRAKSLLAGSLKTVTSIPAAELDNVLEARAEGIKATISASLQEIQRAESLTEKPSSMASFLTPISLGVVGVGALGFFVMRLRKKPVV